MKGDNILIRTPPMCKMDTPENLYGVGIISVHHCIKQVKHVIMKRRATIAKTARGRPVELKAAFKTNTNKFISSYVADTAVHVLW